MSNSVTLSQVVALASQLQPAERKRLTEGILTDLSSAATPRRRSWREPRGALPHPTSGEDAQAWVTRSR